MVNSNNSPQAEPKQQQIKITKQQIEDMKSKSCTLYVGNLSFYTTEEQIYELFSKCGEIKKYLLSLYLDIF